MSIKYELTKEKQQLNMLTKLLVAKLQAFKHGLNSKTTKTENIINEQFPISHATYLSSIATDYENVITSANLIIELQDRPLHKTELRSESSWWGSRLKARVSLLSLDKNERLIRLLMLKALNDAIKDLETVENTLLDSDSESIADATKKFIEFWHLFDGVVVVNADKLPRSKALPPVPSESSGNQTGDIVLESDKLSILRTKFTELESKLSMAGDSLPELKQKMYGKSLAKIEKMFIDIKLVEDEREKSEKIAKIEHAINTLENSLNKVIQKLKTEAADGIDDDIYKVAHNALTRWFKRKLMSMNPKRQEFIKLDIVEQLHELNGALNKLMDLLEDPAKSTLDILKYIDAINLLISKIGNKIYVLASIYFDSSLKPKLRRNQLSSLKNKLIDIEGDDEE